MKKSKLPWVRCILITLIIGVSTNIQAQITTSIYKDREVKDNSIIVKYDDRTISAKGNTFTPQALASEVKTDLNAIVQSKLQNQNVEEWIISGDMEASLKRLNSIPGVRAFPNYVFHRDEIEPRMLSQEDMPVILNEERDGTDHEKPQLQTNLPTLSIGNLDSFTAIPIVYEEDFNDTANVYANWFFVDWAGTEVYWEMVDDGNGGFMPQVSNSADSAVDVAADLYSPGLDMSDFDSTKSYRLKFDMSNNYYPDTFIGLFYDSENNDNGVLDMSVYDQFVWWDISRFVGDTLYVDFYVEAYGVPAGQTLVSIDNMVIEEYPVNDSWIEQQYALYNDGLFSSNSVEGADISAFDAWEQNTGSEDVVVVVFDDGVDFDHTDLMNQAWVNPGETPGNGVDDDGNGYIDDVHGWSPIYEDNSFLNDGSFHGTHVAGIIGAEANNSFGISGVSQNVSIISVMIFDEFGSTTALAILDGYDYISTLLENEVEITAVNQSWGGGAYLDYENDAQFVNTMTTYALEHDDYGALWVVSAGNGSSDRDEMPYYSYPNNIQSPNIITVASTNDAEQLSGFSDYGVRTVDIGAPGSDIISTFPLDGMAYMSGTSMASPQVTGAIALAKAQYPDESGLELLVRTLGSADIMAQYQGVVGEGGRLNVNAILSPAAEGNADALVASHGTAHFHRTSIDGDAFTTIGFINNTGSTVTINDVTISGTDSDKFLLPLELSTSEVAANGAFAIPVSFNNDGEDGEFTATATISTSAGDVVIELNGKEQGFPIVLIEPEFTDAGEVEYGSEVEAQFTITNEGNAGLNYRLGQELYLVDEELTSIIESFSTFTPSKNAVEKGSASGSLEWMKEFTAQVLLNRGDKKLPKITYEAGTHPRLNDHGAEIVFSEDFESIEDFEVNWTIENAGSGDVWEIEEYDAGDGTNNVLLFGDFNEGYQNNSLAAAIPPAFDFSNLDSGHGPVYLAFDVMAELEEGWDFFYINVISDGSLLETLVDTDDGSIINYGGYYRVYADISHLIGYEDIEFWFIGNTDGSIVDGFGALIDNVEVLVDDIPYFTSVLSGHILAGGHEDVTVTVRTDMLPDGEFYLFTDVFSNTMLSYHNPFAPYHTLYFDSRDVSVIPPVAVDDEIAILSGDVISLDELFTVMLENDSDEDSEFWIYDFSDPLHGSFKYMLEGDEYVYVAPLNYDGDDQFSYVISDGSNRDTATVYISVHAQPGFVTGSDKQYVFLEDEELTLSTIGMAAGVGGMDGDLIIWGESGHDNISISHDGENHTITFSADEDFFGQGSGTLHVGYEGEDPMDFMELSIVVIPVNDPPVVDFEETAEGAIVSFIDNSSDPKDAQDGGIVKWEWNFGDGNTSEDRNPVHTYSTDGTYEVSLTVTDNGGLSATFAKEVEVNVGVSNEPENIPVEYALNQNYPNPFNPNTIVKYSIPEASKVSIVVYDLLGKKVAELVNSQKAAGNYTVNFDASNLTSGIYIYQIRAGSYTNTKKMTLIK
ncbi:MAG: S8 family serine peptidase [Gracilimonas sp.]